MRGGRHTQLLIQRRAHEAELAMDLHRRMTRARQNFMDGNLCRVRTRHNRPLPRRNRDLRDAEPGAQNSDLAVMGLLKNSLGRRHWKIMEPAGLEYSMKYPN